MTFLRQGETRFGQAEQAVTGPERHSHMTRTLVASIIA